MELSYSKRSTSKSVTDFSINSLKSKLQFECMQKNLNPSRSRNIILAKSSSLMNVKIKIKNDHKFLDRLMYTTNSLKKAHSILKKLAFSHEQKNKSILKSFNAIDNIFNFKMFEKRDLEYLLEKKQIDKCKFEKSYQAKLTSTNKIVKISNNMVGTVYFRLFSSKELMKM